MLEKTEIMCEFLASILPADGLVPLGAKTSAGKVMNKFGTGRMMTSSNGIIFRVTGPLLGHDDTFPRGRPTGHRWIPLTKASDAEL